ncbi:MAG: AraC family transcriptional regulator [Bacteroidales bacterium]|nr:AraC family transcriptional regulator [Bacteroidales bacterium]
MQKEIATRTGFKNLSSFSRFFKKQTGMTPGEYRDSQGV